MQEEVDALEEALRTSAEHARALKERAGAVKRTRRAAREAELEWRRSFFELAGTATPYVAVTSDGALFFADTADTHIGKDLFTKGARKETRTLTRALDVLEAIGAPVGRELFLDVGANIGTTAIGAVTVHGFRRAMAFEPDPANHRLLRVNVVANDLDRRVETFEAAVSEHAATLTLVQAGTSSGKHWIDGAGTPEGGGVHHEVRALALDDLVAEGRIDPGAVGLLWIDVEGHEGHVLAGAATLLDRNVPVAMELAPQHLERAGRLAETQELIRRHFTHLHDLHRAWEDGRPVLVPTTELAALCDDYAARGRFTDVLLCSPARV